MDKYEINNSEDLILISNGHPLREISIKSIEGYLRANGINCRSIYLDSVTELHQIELEQILALSQNAKLVGFSMMSKDVMLMLPLIEKLKKNNIPNVMSSCSIFPTIPCSAMLLLHQSISNHALIYIFVYSFVF